MKRTHRAYTTPSIRKKKSSTALILHLVVNNQIIISGRKSILVVKLFLVILAKHNLECTELISTQIIALIPRTNVWPVLRKTEAMDDVIVVGIKNTKN